MTFIFLGMPQITKKLLKFTFPFYAVRIHISCAFVTVLCAGGRGGRGECQYEVVFVLSKNKTKTEKKTGLILKILGCPKLWVNIGKSPELSALPAEKSIEYSHQSIIPAWKLIV